MLDAEVQRISNLYNVAIHAKHDKRELDVPIAPFGHARLIYRIRSGKITLVLLRTREEPLIIDNQNSLSLLQYGNLHNKIRVETLQLAYDLLYN